MSADSVLIFLLFLSALAIGYVLARSPIDIKRSFHRGVKRSSGERYQEGLKYLFVEQPDEAIDALTSTLEVSEDTLETHMALGGMLRKRGEVDRAIRVHQNVLSREGLPQEQLLQVRLALAEDYLKAGLYDRAEALYRELSEVGESDVAKAALERLVDVYQRETEWQQAIVSAETLVQLLDGDESDHWRRVQAQFYCEIAEQALTRGYYADVEQALGKAVLMDPDLARTLILKGRLALAENNNEKALALLKQVPLHFTAHNAQVLPLLIDAYNRTHSQGQLQSFLADLYREQPSVLLLPAMARAMAEQESEAVAILFLIQEIEHWTHLSSLSDILSILPQATYQQISLESLLGVVEQRLQQTQAYECQGCGYSGCEHHWQCPRCNQWGSVASVH